MNVDPGAILALLAEQQQRIAALTAENQALRATLDGQELGQ